MMKSALAATILMSVSIVPSAEAKTANASGFWSTLDRNGTLSAGWVQVLPVLASACNLRLDNRELNAKLVDLSLDNGNEAYATNLYSTLNRIEKHRSKNAFVDAWTAMFQGKQQDACDTAEALWGNLGKQFPGVLRREASASSDVTSSIAQRPSEACQ